MSDEISALEKNGTWQLVEPPVNSDIIDCRWVYKVKETPQGKTKCKARLVARGFSQVYGDSYWETYAPVVKSSSVRMLIACAVERDWIIDQIDVRNAYVQSDLSDTVYMRQPPGFDRQDGRVCKLKKSLYGLKQAGNEWSRCLSAFLTNELKFTRLQSDPCIYVRGTGADQIILSVYVDDILIFATHRREIIEFKAAFEKKFEIDDIGECKRIIGIDVERHKDGSVCISQRTFIRDLIERYGQADCNGQTTPMNNSVELCCGSDNCGNCQMADAREYRAIIGRLLYIAGTSRPDIAYAVSSLSRFNSKAHVIHMKAAIRVVQYLKTTQGLSIRYRKTGLPLFGHSDADWANCKLDRKSYSGSVIILAGAPVSWEARKQLTIALSSTEAEYVAMGSAVKEILFCQQILEELGLEESSRGPTELFVDNKSSINLASRIGYSARTKHIDVKHHFIRELVENGRVRILHVRSEENLADVCTKGLGPIKHKAAVQSMLYGG